MRSRELSYDFPVYDYVDLFDAEFNEVVAIYEGGNLTDEERLWVPKRIIELKEEIRYYKTEIFPEAARRQGITLIEKAAPASSPEISRDPSFQAHPVLEEPEEEEPELEEEEYSEEEEEEGVWANIEPEELPLFREELLTDEVITPIRMTLEEASIKIGDPIIGMTNEHVRGFMLKEAYKRGVKTIKDFNLLDWTSIFNGDDDDEPEAEEPIVIEGSYDEVSGTVLVRTGDIIEIKTVDPPRANNINKVHSPEHSMEAEVITNTGTPSLDVIEDVAHHTEPKETSKDAARDELFINSEDQAADEFSEEEKLSVSIDPTMAVDRHRADNELDEISQDFNLETSVSIDEGKTVDRQQEDNCPNELSVQPSVQNEFTDFIFPPESHQHSHDIPVLEESSREDDAWSYARSLSGIVVFIKNCAKRLSARIDRRRTKGALAQPFDSLD